MLMTLLLFVFVGVVANVVVCVAVVDVVVCV